MENGYILDKELLEERLRQLAVTPYSGDICRGAMCYSPEMPDSGEYVCAICSRTTIHRFGEYMVEELKDVRGLVDGLKALGYDVELDEREFCQYCREITDYPKPRPVFKIRFNENDDYHTLSAELSYFKYLEAFLKGGDHFEGERGDTMTLHENIDIISKMTGLGEDTAKAWLNRPKRRVVPMNRPPGLKLPNKFIGRIDRENVGDDGGSDD